MRDEQERTDDAHEADPADEHHEEPGDDAPGATEPPRVTAPPRPFDDEATAAAEPDAAPTDDAAEEEPAPEVVAEEAEPEEPAPFEDLSELPSLLEALLFVADHPIDVPYLSRAVEVSQARVEYALDALAESLRAERRGIRLQRGPEGVQLVSAPEAAAYVERFLGLEANRRLSTAALETLAIIAYRQPITRGQIDAIRGVSSDGAVATLRARDLIEPAGHAAGPGRPMLFRTTQRFLEHFGLERPGQLPPLPEDIELPPAEIGAQLGLDEALVEEALRPREEPELAAEETSEAEEAAARGEEQAPEASDGAEDEVEQAITLAAAGEVEITSDLRALSEAAEHAFEASRWATPPAEPADDAGEASEETSEPSEPSERGDA